MEDLVKLQQEIIGLYEQKDMIEIRLIVQKTALRRMLMEEQEKAQKTKQGEEKVK